jgi:hypothetical protein
VIFPFLQGANVTPPQYFRVAIGDKVEPDRPVTGAGKLEKADSVDVYNFQAQPHQRIYIERLDCDNDDSSLKATLTAPDGTQLPSLTDVYLKCKYDIIPPVELPSKGDYQLRIINSFGGLTGGLRTYSFKIWNSPIMYHTMQLGAPIAGEIRVPQSVDVYTFTLDAGKSVSFAARPDCGTTLHWTLASPSGRTILDDKYVKDCTTGIGTEPYRLPENGTYKLTVTGTDNDTGHYRFIGKLVE